MDLYATVRGAGTTAIVVMHGFTGGHRHGSFQRLLGWLADSFMVVAIDMRGHHFSQGRCTLGHLEAYDVDAAVRWARQLGAERVFTLGFSLGSAAVLRHAALSQPHIALPEFDRAISIENAPDGVISVGGVSRWFFRGSRPMWLMHWALAFPWGRAYVRNKMKVDVDLTTWPAEAHPRLHEIQPLDPRACVATIAPTPLLIIQGEHDNYFPPEHGEKLYAAAQVPQHQAEYWFVSGMGQAQNAITRDGVDQLKQWVASHVRSGR